MPRKPTALPQPPELPAAEILDAHDQANRDTLNALAALNAQAAQAAQAVALQVGYDGTLTVGALEDEIRFYQRRTVEAILETGKRLLVLREFIPKGNSQNGKDEFVARVELLGFSKSTAYRFMQAAAKTAKSANLAQISTQVKSASAFLELVTHDDDTIVELSKLDEFDKMSASELREAARVKDKAIAKWKSEYTEKNEALIALQTKTGAKVAADVNWPDALIPITDQIAACKRDIDHIFSKLESARIAVLQVEMSEDQRPKFEAALAHVAEVYASALASAERHYLKDQVIFAQTLGAFLADEE